MRYLIKLGQEYVIEERRKLTEIQKIMNQKSGVPDEVYEEINQIHTQVASKEEKMRLFEALWNLIEESHSQKKLNSGRSLEKKISDWMKEELIQ